MAEPILHEYDNNGLTMLTSDSVDWEDTLGNSSRQDSSVSGVLVRFSAVEPDDTDPHARILLSTNNEVPTHARHLLSPMQTCVSIIKCAIGAGSFALPYAFYEGGLYVSFFLTLIIGAVSAYTIYILGVCERKLVHQILRRSYLEDDSNQGGVKTKLSYPEVGAAAFPDFVFTFCDVPYNIMEGIIYIGIVLTSLGVCAAFVDFITSTMADVLNGWSDSDAFDRGTVTAIIVPFMLALAFLKSFRLLAFTSILGDIAVTAGLVAVIAYGASEFGKDASMKLPFVKPKSLPNFFGSTAFLFAIHIVVLPIMQNMREPKRFRSVVNMSYTFITVINAFFGAIAYVLFAPSKCDSADETYHGPCGNVLDNLDGGWVLDAVKVLVCIDLLFTVPMVFAAAREIIENALILHMFGRQPYTTLDYKEPYGVDPLRYVTRTVLVGVVIAITFVIPEFQNMVGLVGGFVNSLMGFILPPIIYLKVVGETQGLWWNFMHYAIIVFGVFALVVSTWFTVLDIVS